MNKNISILLFSLYLFINSCSSHSATKEDAELVILFKQESIASDAEFSFEKKYFWKDNKENNTFITQNFTLLNYNDIIKSVKESKFVGNYSPEYSNHVIYSFILYKNEKGLNDTIYYDGYSKWWIISNKKELQYEDNEGKLSDKLKRFYPIFRNCSYPN